MLRRKSSYFLIASLLLSITIYLKYASNDVEIEINQTEDVAIKLSNTSQKNSAMPEKISTNKPVFVKDDELYQEDAEPMNSESSISDTELINLARDAINGDNPELKAEAFNVLLNLVPTDAADILNGLAQQKKVDAYVEQMAVTGMLQLQSNTDLLTNNDLKNLFQLDSKTLKKLAAQILSDRGDTSLANSDSNLFDSDIENENPGVRLQTLFEITSLHKVGALPNIKLSLKDADSSIRLQALNLISVYGSDKDVTSIEPLLMDTNAQVRIQSQLALKSLWRKNTPLVLTDEPEFAPPTSEN